jgi:phage terminase large subunit
MTLQIQTARAFQPLLQPARFKGAYGGRGGGKSHTFAGLLVARALNQPGLRVLCVRETMLSLKQSSKRLIEDKVQAFGAGGKFQILNDAIRTPGDGMIVFVGMANHTAESIKSYEGFDICWVEEAQALSQRSLDLLLPTIRKAGSELWFSWNPRTERDPVDRLFRGGEPPPGSIIVNVNYSDNPWLSKEAKAQMAYDRRRDPDKYQHIWLGGYERHPESRVFHNWKVGEVDIPGDARPYFGADWGYAKDPTVLVRTWIIGRTAYVDKEVYKIRCDIDHTPALFEKIQDVRTSNVREWPIVADSSRPETIAYMRARGFRITGAKKGDNSVKDGVEFLQSYDLVVHPDCRHSIDELSLYSYKTDKLTGDILPELADKHNHVIDALRYAVESLRRRGQQKVYTGPSASLTRSGWEGPGAATSTTQAFYDYYSGGSFAEIGGATPPWRDR